ncbi:acyl carrier protein [Pleurocapsales cyanobacterium LEGE 06147]|nr:acyl carrier protein [Pleurocapsales cyanobacterium LEGE 06147]
MEIKDLQITKMPTVSVNNQSAFEGNIRQESPIEAEIQEWIISYLAQMLEVSPDEINVTTAFDRYGLDSSAAVGLTGDLEDWLGIELEPTLMYDYPTIETLTEYLAEQFTLKV